jgi:hypothetical protein
MYVCFIRSPSYLHHPEHESVSLHVHRPVVPCPRILQPNLFEYATRTSSLFEFPFAQHARWYQTWYLFVSNKRTVPPPPPPLHLQHTRGQTHTHTVPTCSSSAERRPSFNLCSKGRFTGGSRGKVRPGSKAERSWNPFRSATLIGQFNMID